MNPFNRVRDLYLQEAPAKVVMQSIHECPDWLELSFQERIVNECINNPLIVKNGHVQDYEYLFIRMYFDQLMAHDVYIADSLAVEYDRIHNHPSEEGEYHFCYYPIPDTDQALQVKLKRSCNCTAFKTWEACFAFMEWAYKNPHYFATKTILELGAGSGLCGQMLQCIIPTSHIVMSDYCDDVTEYILGNIEENNAVYKALQCEIPKVMTVDFCKPNIEDLKQLKASTIIATDVTFSPDLIDGLIETLAICLTQCSCEKAYICCTIRTEELYNRFKNGIEGKGLKTVEHVLEQQNIWYYFQYAPIVVLEISN